MNQAALMAIVDGFNYWLLIQSPKSNEAPAVQPDRAAKQLV
jgi:hypothetical protein